MPGVQRRPSCSSKDITDTIMNLTQQLHILEGGNGNDISEELGVPKHQLEEKEIELALENQHVNDDEETHKMKAKSMIGLVKNDQR